MFQFTHPGRGATGEEGCYQLEHLCFNSRTPGGVRLCHRLEFAWSLMFQFTHPGRGATLSALGVEAEVSFNSRTPGGVRQNLISYIHKLDLFQFTHPGRGATGA